MKVLKTEDFKNEIYDYETSKEWRYKGSRPAIIDFYADWCGPCRMLSPILDRVSETYKGKVDIFKVDTEATPELAALFGVRGIPSLLFIPTQGEPAMSSGVIPEESFEKAINELFQISKPIKPS